MASGILRRGGGIAWVLFIVGTVGCSHGRGRGMAPPPGPPQEPIPVATAEEAGGAVAESEATEPAPGAPVLAAPPPAPQPMASDDSFADRAPARRAMAFSGAMVRPAPPPPPPPPSSVVPTPGQPAPAPQPAAGARKVHYHGQLRVVATKPEELLDRAATVAKEAGGYVERLAGHQLTVRVPVERFRAVWKQLLELGEVLHQEITAQDITEAFQAVELRLRVLKASRQRLIELLAKAANEHEKLALLGEIKRLTEEIDQLEISLQSLASLAALSRIVIEAVPRPRPSAQLAQQELGAFRWIAQLSPFSRDVASASDRLELPVPTGMVELQRASWFDSPPWVARSADGAAIWSGLRKNEPRGDTVFWLEAVKRRLAERYPDHTDYRVGGFAVLELRDSGKPGYRYLIAVRAAGDELQVVEVYYPSSKQQQRHGQAIKRALQRFAGGA